MDTKLPDYLRDLSTATSAATATDHLVSFMEAQGAHVVHAWFGYELEGRSVSTFPDWWWQWYWENDYGRYDHIGRHCMARTEPTFWGVDIDCDNPAVRPNALECSRVAFEGFELRNAIVFPIHVPNRGLSGGVSFGVDFGDTEFKKLLRDIQPDLHVAAVAAHIRMQSLIVSELAQAVRLSNRERECLLWLAKGLQTARIAERLSIQDVTVNFYVGKAKKKLRVRTREQTVAKAIVLGLIEL